MNKFHCCATCEHFQVLKGKKTTYKCARLGYETHPKYQFNCWSPKAQVKKLMEKEGD